MTRRPRLRAAVCLLLLGLSACSSWRGGASPANPSSYDARTIRVIRYDGTAVVLRRPTVQGDSVRGWARARGDAAPREVAVALSDVLRVERRRISGGKTAALVGGVVAGAGLVGLAALAVVLSNWDR